MTFAKPRSTFGQRPDMVPRTGGGAKASSIRRPAAASVAAGSQGPADEDPSWLKEAKRVGLLGAACVVLLLVAGSIILRKPPANDIVMQPTEETDGAKAGRVETADEEYERRDRERRRALGLPANAQAPTVEAGAPKAESKPGLTAEAPAVITKSAPVSSAAETKTERSDTSPAKSAAPAPAARISALAPEPAVAASRSPDPSPAKPASGKAELSVELAVEPASEPAPRTPAAQPAPRPSLAAVEQPRAVPVEGRPVPARTTPVAARTTTSESPPVTAKAVETATTQPPAPRSAPEVPAILPPAAAVTAARPAEATPAVAKTPTAMPPQAPAAVVTEVSAVAARDPVAVKVGMGAAKAPAAPLPAVSDATPSPGTTAPTSLSPAAAPAATVVAPRVAMLPVAPAPSGQTPPARAAAAPVTSAAPSAPVAAAGPVKPTDMVANATTPPATPVAAQPSPASVTRSAPVANLKPTATGEKPVRLPIAAKDAGPAAPTTAKPAPPESAWRRFVTSVSTGIDSMLASSSARPQQSALQDCPDCPALAAVQPGFFMVPVDPTASQSAPGRPMTRVRIGQAYAISTAPVTIQAYARFITASGHPRPACAGALDGDTTRSMTCVTYADARAYASWLAGQTGRAYRLPSATEWGYATRSAPGEGSAAARGNAHGLTEVGRLHELVADCWMGARSLPTDGRAAATDACRSRTVMGGSGDTDNTWMRSELVAGPARADVGFRVVRELDAKGQ